MARQQETPVSRGGVPWSLALLSLAVLAFGTLEVDAHHPVGLPQYREQNGEIVMIYNVLTQDYRVRLLAAPGRPVPDPVRPVTFSVEIVPKDPLVTFQGKTYLSVVENMGDRGETEIVPATPGSSDPGARTLQMSHAFDHEGSFVVKVEFMESPGREVLSFPLTVGKGGMSPGTPFLRYALPVGVALFFLVLAGLASRRRARRTRGVDQPQ
jgi:hypothetical protein